MTGNSTSMLTEHGSVTDTVLGVLQDMADEQNESIEIQPSSNLAHLLNELDESLGLLIFQMELEKRLCVRFSQEELATFFWPKAEQGHNRTFEEWQRDVEPGLTIAAFVDWLQLRVQPISFEPVSILGSPPCQAAGYFLGMREIVERMAPETERFAPSTPIVQVLPLSQIQQFWERLSLTSQRTLPPLKLWLNHLANVLLIGATVYLLFGVFVNWAFLTAIWLLCLKVLQIGWELRKRANPLPRGIVTFGDLSRYLARHPIHKTLDPVETH